MERVIGIEHQGGWAREQARAERLRHRRAAADRCVRGGLMRLCRPDTPGDRKGRTA
jgi:hypothetical protein